MFLRIFDRYIGKQVFAATATGVVVLSGVMVLGNVYKKLDQLLGNTELPLSFVLHFIALVIPFSLIFTIPWAFLTSILLVFGRMSADNELVSLRMTGSSMPRICLPVFLLALALSSVCYYVNVDVAPAAKNQMKRLFYRVATEDPTSLFQEGRVLDKFPGYRIHTGDRDGLKLTDLTIVEMEGNRARRTIRAKRARLEIIDGELDFILHLEEADVESTKTDDQNQLLPPEFIHFEKTALTFPLSRLKERTERVNASMKTTSALWGEVLSGIDSESAEGAELDRRTLSESRTELNKRYSFSLACITFALVGIPLGVTAQRRETSVGFALSLIIALAYMLFILVGDILNSKPGSYPHLLMWAPNVIFLSVGSVLFYRLSRR
jgi:lipopolysaccharide export LptBFGC system permease protein LptF